VCCTPTCILYDQSLALFLAAGLLIDSILMEHVDGNGIMLSKYHRNATISNSELRYIGGSAMAGWGWTDELSDGGVHGYDGRGGDFPRFTLIKNNIVRELGLWEKQASAWFQAKTAQTTIVNNLFFNGPRAGVNFNVRTSSLLSPPLLSPEEQGSTSMYVISPLPSSSLSRRAGHNFNLLHRITSLTPNSIDG
jgi:hypothetical protein